MVGRIRSRIKKSLQLSLATFLAFWQIGFTLVPLLVTSSTAKAAELCEVDVQGADDEPGQKDLTKMCSDTATAASGFITIKWNWDDTAWSGNNSGDACALFDTDNDTFANYSLCAVVKNNPAQIIDTRVYSCSDAKKDRCTNPNQDNSITSSCTVSIGATQPFGSGSATPNDTTATCTIQLSDVGGVQSTELIDVCSYPSQQPNSDPSDCIIATTRATVEVVKQIVPDTDTGKFDLFIDGTRYVDDGGDNASTGPKVVDDTQSVIVKEEAGLSTLLTNYTTSVSCVNQDNVTVATGNPEGIDSRQTTINHQNIAKGDTIVCTFTNTRQNANIQVVKDVINDNGGNKTYADFTFQVNGGAAQNFEVTTSPDGAKTISVPIGSTYTITEPEANQNGYTTTYSNCSNIVPVVGQTQVCTITNNDVAPTLTVIKNVVNDDGGNNVVGDFGITLNSGALSFGSGAVNGSITTYTATPNVSANTNYTLSENDVTGYTEGVWSCDDGTTGTGRDVTINLALDEDVTCTITNDDVAPVLTIVKQVINNNGGDATADDFVLRLNGSALSSPVMSNSNLTATYTASNPFANTSYTVSEDSVSGYDPGQGVACVDGAGQSISHPVTLGEGQSATCTITNDDISPTLQLIKNVINNNGGTLLATDWTLYATPDTNTLGATTVSGSGGFSQTNVYANVTYVLSESGVGGYTAGTWSCDGGTLVGSSLTLSLAQNVICMITNDDNAPSLTLVKQVTNDNGGQRTASEWTLTATGASNEPTNLSGAGGATSGSNFKADTYTLAETGPTDYAQGTWSCTNSVSVNGNNQITLTNGQSTTCTITNDDIAPTLTVIKEVVNDDGGDETVDDFGITLNGSGLSFGGGVMNGDTTTYTATPTALANTNYTLSENDVDGYSEGTWSCSDGTNGTGRNVTINLAPDEDVTCTVTNDDIAPVLTLQKIVVNDNGGEAEASDWTLTATPTSGSAISGNGENGVSDEAALAHTTYTLSEDGPDGYSAGDWSCTSSAGVFSHPNGNTSEIRMSEGADVTCTITNNDISPELTLVKNIIDSEESTATEDDFTPTLNGTNTTWGTHAVDVGTYTVDELEEQGWRLNGISCYVTGSPATGVDHPVELGLGDEVTCVVTNEEMGSITVIKDAVPNDEQDFHFTITQDVSCEIDFLQLIDLCYLLDNISLPLDTEVASFDLDDDSDLTLSNTETTEVEPGEWYTITEDQVPGWDLTDIDCGDIRLEETENGVMVHVDTGEDITCTFTNTKRANVQVIKYSDNNQNGVQDAGEASLTNWEITLNDTKQLTGQDGSTTFTNLLPNEQYTVSETQQDGWTLTRISCVGVETAVSSQASETSVEVFPVAGETVTCKIGNFKPSPAVLAAQVLADTGETRLWSNMVFGISLLIAAVATMFLPVRSSLKSND